MFMSFSSGAPCSSADGEASQKGEDKGKEDAEWRQRMREEDSGDEGWCGLLRSNLFVKPFTLALRLVKDTHTTLICAFFI
jgi:hypothetical protein